LSRGGRRKKGGSGIRKLRREPEQPGRGQIEHRQNRPVLQAVVADRPAQLSDELGQAVGEASGGRNCRHGREHTGIEQSLQPKMDAILPPPRFG